MGIQKKKRRKVSSRFPGDEKRIKDAISGFTREMAAKLAQNKHKLPWWYSGCQSLLVRLEQELLELKHAVENPDLGGARSIRDEAVDVANFALMVWDVAEGEERSRARLRNICEGGFCDTRS